MKGWERSGPEFCHANIIRSNEGEDGCVLVLLAREISGIDGIKGQRWSSMQSISGQLV